MREKDLLNKRSTMLQQFLSIIQGKAKGEEKYEKNLLKMKEKDLLKVRERKIC